ncbi:MAG: hypothetical protein AAFX50_13200, partial [Acidobacteriota bacterium]
KTGFVQLGGLAPANYKVIFMLRHPKEIRMSYEALGEASARQQLGWSRPEEYLPLMKRYVAAASMRVDMHVLEVWYHDVINESAAVFERIREFGFPIDVAAAAGAIDRSLYRHRVEDKEITNEETQGS